MMMMMWMLLMTPASGEDLEKLVVCMGGARFADENKLALDVFVKGTTRIQNGCEMEGLFVAGRVDAKDRLRIESQLKAAKSVKCGNDCYIGDDLHTGGRLETGDRFHVNDNCYVEWSAFLGHDCHIGDDLAANFLIQAKDRLRVVDDLSAGGRVDLGFDCHVGTDGPWNDGIFAGNHLTTKARFFCDGDAVSERSISLGPGSIVDGAILPNQDDITTFDEFDFPFETTDFDDAFVDDCIATEFQKNPDLTVLSSDGEVLLDNLVYGDLTLGNHAVVKFPGGVKTIIKNFVILNDVTIKIGKNAEIVTRKLLGSTGPNLNIIEDFV